MKHKNLLKAVEKIAPVEFKPGKSDNYCSTFKNNIISWHVAWYEKEEGIASLVRVRNINDHDEIISDYIAGCYYDTIKSAIHSFSN